MGWLDFQAFLSCKNGVWTPKVGSEERTHFESYWLNTILCSSTKIWCSSTKIGRPRRFLLTVLLTRDSTMLIPRPKFVEYSLWKIIFTRCKWLSQRVSNRLWFVANIFLELALCDFDQYNLFQVWLGPLPNQGKSFWPFRWLLSNWKLNKVE